jgi:hypothetical protein
MVYALADRGARLLSQSSLEYADLAIARNNQRAGRPFIDHQLEIVEFYVALELSLRRHRDIGLIHSDELISGFPGATRGKPHPLTLRATIAYDGKSQEIGIVPDLVFGIRFRDGSRRCFMVEIDRGTMPINRSNLSQSSFERKMCGYLAAYAAKQHEQHLGWKAFRVLTVTTDQHRLGSIVKSLGALSARARSRLLTEPLPWEYSDGEFDRATKGRWKCPKS